MPIVATTDARAVLEATLVGEENLLEGEPKDAETPIRLQRIANPANLDEYGSALWANSQMSAIQQRALTQAGNLMMASNFIITGKASACNSKAKRFNKDAHIRYLIVLTFLFPNPNPLSGIAGVSEICRVAHSKNKRHLGGGCHGLPYRRRR